MFGFYGRVLNIDVTEQKWWVNQLPDNVLARCLGGKGLGTYLLRQEVDPQGDPLGPDNCFVLATGPATSPEIPGGARFGAFALSPQTLGYAESYAGGNFGPVLKSSGYDAVIVKGKAQAPVVLSISPEEVRFLPAGDLWGKDAFTTEQTMLASSPAQKPQALAIGPAGENLVRIACINTSKWRQLGRTGLGAVLGSKRVKGIVVSGDRAPVVADPGGLREWRRRLVDASRGNPGVKFYRTYGTPGVVSMTNSAKCFPTRYWQEGQREDWPNIGPERFLEVCDVRSKACPGCFMACGKLATVKDGPYRGLTIEGPEYETIYAFGGLCLIDDIPSIMYLNHLCDKLGLDTISAGNLVGFSIEAARRGKLQHDIDYGDVEAAANLLRLIAARDGVGDLLAEGIAVAARELGLEELAIHVKGLEPAGYDPRVLKGMGLAYATSSRGACHLRTTFYKPELAGIIDPKVVEGKARLLVEYEDRLALYDCLILCKFFRDLVLWDELSELIRVTTGQRMGENEMRRLANAVITETRVFNNEAGMARDADLLPERLVTEPINPEQHLLLPEELRRMLDDYYSLRGWSELGTVK